MTNKEVICKAQEAAGVYVTGYKGDMNCDIIREICKMIWTRAKNLGYSFSEWHKEIAAVIGMKNYKYWSDEILGYQQSMLEASRYFVYHGQRYCA